MVDDDPENYLDQNEKGCRDFEEFDYPEEIAHKLFSSIQFGVVDIYEEEECERPTRDNAFIPEHIQA